MARCALLLLLALAAAGATGGPTTAASGCRSASTDVQALVRSLPVGATLCLHGGRYNGRLVLDRPVTLRGGANATIVGGITVDTGAVGAVLQGLRVQGSGKARAAILVHANGVRVLGNRISGAGFADLNAACVYLDATRDSVVDGNRITACTHATRSTLSAPGVFVGSAYGARVTNNLVTHTVGYGIVLGPNAQHSQVLHNLVDANSGGLLIDGNDTTASSFNVVRNNVFSNSLGTNVHATWGKFVGKHNSVVANCLWHSIGAETDAPGVQLAGNLVADPHYVAPPSNYAMAGGKCAGKHPSILPPRFTALRAFTVAYRLRALPARVQVVSLALHGVTPGAHIAAACSCGVHWAGLAHGDAVPLTAFAGRWLATGAAVTVRATKAGHAGAYAEIAVVGLPHGVRVTHACLAPGGSAPVPCSRYR